MLLLFQYWNYLLQCLYAFVKHIFCMYGYSFCFCSCTDKCNVKTEVLAIGHICKCWQNCAYWFNNLSQCYQTLFMQSSLHIWLSFLNLFDTIVSKNTKDFLKLPRQIWYLVLWYCYPATEYTKKSNAYEIKANISVEAEYCSWQTCSPTIAIYMAVKAMSAISQ